MIFTDKNINIKKFLQQINTIVIVLLALCACACSDDSVTVIDEEFDPPRFNWRSMEVSGEGIAGVWANDTSEIYLVNNYSKSLIRIVNGIQANLYVGEFFLNDIKGTSNSEIYLFATRIIDKRLTLIKWNGGGFEYFVSDIEITNDNYLRLRGSFVSSNEIWACSQNGITKFDGTKFDYYYYQDTSLMPQDIIFTPELKVQYIYNRWETDSLWHTGLFEYVDTGFVNKVSYISNPYSSNSYTFLDNVGGSKIGIKVKYNPKSICIDRFSNYSFDKYFCLGDKISNEGTSETGVIVGTEIQNFLTMVVAKEPIFAPISKLGLLHWDGKTISKEIGLAPTSSPYNYSTHILFCIDNETYVVYEPYSSKNGLPCLYLGNKKK